MSLFYSASSGGFYDDSIHTKEQIPADATSVTSKEYQGLLDAQGEGKLISDNGCGYPIAIDRASPTTEHLAASARANRDILIAGTDYLVMSDYPISADKLLLVKIYRQLLRDITKQQGFPITIDWPQMPE